MTVEQFVAFDNERGDQRWELIEGVARLMAGSSENHAQILINIGSRLYFTMQGRGCRAYQGDMLVRNPQRDDMTTLPEVVVTCGTPGNRRFIDDPVVVVEVLSPSTMEFDRGFKLSFYKDHPTIRHIAIVYQDECRVEDFHRTEEVWRLEVSRPNRSASPGKRRVQPWPRWGLRWRPLRRELTSERGFPIPVRGTPLPTEGRPSGRVET